MTTTRYHFDLGMGRRSVLDPEGVEFANDATAVAHAKEVALELMRNREGKTRDWTILVRDSGCRVLTILRFVDIDPSLDAFDATLRNAMARVAHATGDLRATVREVEWSLFRLRTTMAQADRTLHLAALDGERLP